MYQSITTSNYTFEDTIRGNYLYIDKTVFFHQLVNEEKGFYFLSRPRRFGKSLSVSIFKNMEENYQNIIYSVFRLLGAEIHNEVHMNNGRIDSVIVTRNHIYIFEFKMGQPAKVALA
jgi:hypothetical protein